MLRFLGLGNGLGWGYDFRFFSCRFYTGGELYIEFESIRWQITEFISVFAAGRDDEALSVLVREVLGRLALQCGTNRRL